MSDVHAGKRSMPWGFLGMLALVLVVERGVIQGNLALRNSVGVCWEFTERHARHDAPGRDILCFGDSMVKFGLNQKTIEHDSGRTIANLAVVGGPAGSSYFLLRHALDAGARPSMIVVDFCKDLMTYGPASKKNVFPWSEIVGVRDGVELGLATRDSDLFALVMLEKLFPSLRYRQEIRTVVKGLVAGNGPTNKASALAILRNLRRNQGSLVFDKNTFEDTGALTEDCRATGTWQPLDDNLYFVRRFLELADEHKIPVAWILMPLSPGTQAADELLGNEDRFEKLVRSEMDRHANLRVIDARHPGLEQTDFHDRGHLDRDGSAAVSGAVAEAIRQMEAKKLANLRWVMLPPCSKTESDTSEALGQSWATASATASPKPRSRRNLARRNMIGAESKAKATARK